MPAPWEVPQAPLAPWEQPKTLAPWETPVTDNTPQEPSFIRNLGESARARAEEAIGIGQTAINMGTSLLGQVAGGLRGLYELARTGGDFDAASRGVQESAAFLADNLHIGMSETGADQEEWLAGKINELKEGLEPELVAMGVPPEHAANLASATIDTTLTFLPFVPKGLKFIGKGVKGIGKAGSAAVDAVARGVSADKAPTLGSPIERVGRTGGPIERVGGEPVADTVYFAAQERLHPTPKATEPATPLPPTPLPPEAPQTAPQAPTEAPVRGSVATDLPFDRPKGEVPFYKQGSLKNLVDSPYLRALKVTGGENHPLVAGLRKLETDIIQKRAAFQPLEREYVSVYNAMPKRVRTAYKSALLKGDTEGAVNLLAQSRKLKNVGNAQEFMGRMRTAFDTRFKEMGDTGVKAGYIEGYHPRQIKDPQGFAKEFENIMREHGKTTLSGVEKTRAEVRKLTEAVKESQITFDEYSRKIDRLLNQGVIRKIADPKSQFSKNRELAVVPERLQKYYADPHEAVANYFTDTANVVAERQYLGKGHANAEEGIANRLASELEAGRINEAQFVEWQKILGERFRSQSGGSGLLQRAKNVGYMATIGNPLSAAVQVLDVIPSAMRYGVGKTLRSIVRTLTPGVKKIRPKDIGLYETSHDIVVGKAKILDKTLKWSGFKAVDRFGKTVILNAARNKFKAMARSKRGIAKLEKQGWHHIYNTPEAWEGFLNALKKGDWNNPIVQETAIAELLNTQPIAMSHMPISYLRSPNGRIFYMLKTWALRQVNQIREARAKGQNVLATKLTAGVIASNMVSPHLRDIVSEIFGGEAKDRGDLSDQATAAVVRALLLDQYAINKGLKTGKATDIAGGMAPPVGDILMSLIADSIKAYESGGRGEVADTKVLRYVPIIGPMAKEWLK